MQTTPQGIWPYLGGEARCKQPGSTGNIALGAGCTTVPAGVRLNAIAPGLVMTGEATPLRDIPGVIDVYIENTPLGATRIPTR